jgi:hypothetical protein
MKKPTLSREQLPAYLQPLALAEPDSGAYRISMRKLLEQVRASTKHAIDNNDIPHVTDRLIELNPHLDDLIERRARGTRGRNKPVPAIDLHPDVAVLASLLAGRDLRITSVSFRSAGPHATTATADMEVLRRLLPRSLQDASQSSLSR